MREEMETRFTTESILRSLMNWLCIEAVKIKTDKKEKISFFIDYNLTLVN
jgi:hypothetical protein